MRLPLSTTPSIMATQLSDTTSGTVELKAYRKTSGFLIEAIWKLYGVTGLGGQPYVVDLLKDDKLTTRGLFSQHIGHES